MISRSGVRPTEGLNLELKSLCCISATRSCLVRRGISRDASCYETRNNSLGCERGKQFSDDVLFVQLGFDVIEGKITQAHEANLPRCQ